LPTPDAPTTATSSASWTVRFTPLRTRRTSPPAWYSFSTPSATISGARGGTSASSPGPWRPAAASGSLIPEHPDREQPSRPARWVEGRQEREDQGSHGDQDELRGMHLHRELRELVDVARDLDDVVTVLDDADGDPEERANRRPDETDEHAFRHEDEGD